MSDPSSARSMAGRSTGDRARHGEQEWARPLEREVEERKRLEAALREAIDTKSTALKLAIAAVTGYGQDRVRESAGFYAHFVKPVGLGQLMRSRFHDRPTR